MSDPILTVSEIEPHTLCKVTAPWRRPSGRRQLSRHVESRLDGEQTQAVALTVLFAEHKPSVKFADGFQFFVIFRIPVALLNSPAESRS